MTQSLLEFEQAEISYGGRPVVRDLSFQIAPGEILGIVGESGSGKSTVIRAAIGLLGKNGRVTKGNIWYGGTKLTEASQKELRRLRGPEIGMIFQNTGASLCPVRTIEAQLFETVLAHEKAGKEEIRERALRLFSLMGLSDGERILKSYPFELSGGMNQRVGIMMAMVLGPRLLLADEPTSALDVTVQARVIREMLQMRETWGTAIAIVTHNIGVVERMADKVAVMHQGRLVEYGTKEEVLREPKAAYTRRLMEAVLHIDRG